MIPTIISRTEETLTRRTTVIDLGEGDTVTVIDYVDEFDKIVDTVYRDDDGNELDSAALIERIEEFMNEQMFPTK